MTSGLKEDIGVRLTGYQEDLRREGRNFSADVEERYVGHWTKESTGAALRIRTALVTALHDFLSGRGLLNIDRVSMSPITDPLAHDVEHSPVIAYKGVPYRATHSMIYSKMLACINPGVPGIFVDSPNIRLELPDAAGRQRGKYLVDFSQMDFEFRRRARIGEAMYRDEEEAVSSILAEERDRALDFIEDLACFALARVAEREAASLDALGVRIEVPTKPFPRFMKDEAEGRLGSKAVGGLEKALGRECGSPFFWILGLYRENYDLVYPYRPGEGRKGGAIPSSRIFNYDLCAASLPSGRQPDGVGQRVMGDAFEVLSGGLREWLYPVIVSRLIDNGVLAEEPRFDGRGDIGNMEALGGYGPFLAAARLRDAEGLPRFPETAGGGLGIERFLFAILRGSKIRRIEDVTLFGKNPDSASLYLF